MIGQDDIMDKNEFWKLIQDAYKEANWETDKQMELLVDKLANYSQEDILKFGKIYEIYDKEANQSKLHAAAYVMNGAVNGGCSTQCFKYFRAWLISRGEDAYLNALKDPDSLIDLDIPYDNDYFENEFMVSLTQSAFNKSIGAGTEGVEGVECVEGIGGIDDSIAVDLDTYYEKMHLFELTDDEIQNIVGDISFDDDIGIKWNEENLESIVPKLYAQYW